MHNPAPTAPSDRLSRFLKRASGLRRTDVEAIIERLMDRLDALDRVVWREAA